MKKLIALLLMACLLLTGCDTEAEVSSEPSPAVPEVIAGSDPETESVYDPATALWEAAAAAAESGYDRTLTVTVSGDLDGLKSNYTITRSAVSDGSNTALYITGAGWAAELWQTPDYICMTGSFGSYRAAEGNETLTPAMVDPTVPAICLLSPEELTELTAEETENGAILEFSTEEPDCWTCFAPALGLFDTETIECEAFTLTGTVLLGEENRVTEETLQLQLRLLVEDSVLEETADLSLTATDPDSETVGTLTPAEPDLSYATVQDLSLPWRVAEGADRMLSCTEQSGTEELSLTIAQEGAQAASAQAETTEKTNGEQSGLLAERDENAEAEPVSEASEEKEETQPETYSASYSWENTLCYQYDPENTETLYGSWDSVATVNGVVTARSSEVFENGSDTWEDESGTGEREQTARGFLAEALTERWGMLDCLAIADGWALTDWEDYRVVSARLGSEAAVLLAGAYLENSGASVQLKTAESAECTGAVLRLFLRKDGILCGQSMKLTAELTRNGKSYTVEAACRNVLTVPEESED